MAIREAFEDDRAVATSILRACGLSCLELLASRTTWWLWEDRRGAVGIVALEVGGQSALLRSAAVLPQARGEGIGAALVARAIAFARRSGVERIYLFSTGAGPYWTKLGFREVDVDEVARALPDAHQVRRYVDDGSIVREVAWVVSISEWPVSMPA